MFCHGLSWFVMVHVMVRDVSLSWFHHGSSWFIMVHCHGSSWFTVMVHCHGSSWFTVMVRHGSSWFTVMVHHGSSWFTVMVRHGSSCFCHGSSWFVMCFSLKFSRKGHVTLNSANQSLKFTIKSHFWWDFLFYPFHLKSIPLKSSAKKEDRHSWTGTSFWFSVASTENKTHIISDFIPTWDVQFGKIKKLTVEQMLEETKKDFLVLNKAFWDSLQ